MRPFAITDDNDCSTRTLRCRLTHGISLIEVIMVLAIIGVVAMLAMPRFANAMARHRLDGAVHRLRADLQAARAKAREISTDVTISFDAANHRYTVSYTEDGQNVVKVVRLSEEPYHINIRQLDLGEASSIVFDGTGAGNATGTINLGSDSSSETIRVERRGDSAATP